MRFFHPIPILCTLVLLLCGAVLAFWSSQWWLPKFAPALLDLVAVQVESVERTESGRIRLEGLRYDSDDGMRIAVDLVELPNLWDYAGARWFSDEWQAEQRVDFGALTVRAGARGASKDTDGSSMDWPALFAKSNRAIAIFEPWLPSISVSELRVLGPEEELLVRVENLQKTGWKLETSLYLPHADQPFSVALSLQPATWSVEAAATQFALKLRATLKQAEDRLALSGSLLQADEVIHFEAAWLGAGSLPDTAALRSKGFSVPPQFVPKTGFTGLDSLRMRRADLQWNGQRYEGEIEIGADTSVEGHAATAVGVAAIKGDTGGLRIQKLDIDTPWLGASLEAPLVVRFPELEFEEAANFRVSADLSSQPFFPAEGSVQGRLSFLPPARVKFELDGRAVKFREYPAGDVRMVGEVDRAGLDLEKLDVFFAEPTQGEVEVSGRMDFEGPYLDFNYKGSVSPALAGTLGLPDVLRETVRLEGSVKGVASDPQWSAKWNAPAIQPPGMQPLEASGNISGTGLHAAHIDAALVNALERIALTLELAKSDQGMLEGVLERFVWEAEEKPRWELAAPSSFALPMDGSITRLFEAAVVEELLLSGPDTDWTLAKPKGGPLHLSGHGFQTGWLDAWTEQPLPAYCLLSADLTIDQLSPLVTGRLSLSVTDSESGPGELHFDLKDIRLGERVEVESLRVALDDDPVLEASGSLPLRLEWSAPAKRPVSIFAKDGPIGIEVRMEPSQAVSEAVRRLTGLVITSPRLLLELTGSVEQPSGRLEASAPSISFQGLALKNENLPAIPDLKELELLADLNGQTLHVSKLKAGIRGGVVAGSGHWPVEGWRDLEMSEQSGLPDVLLRGVFELIFSDWELENWVPYLPAMLRRSGALSGTLRHDPSSGFGGSLSFNELGLRPTQNLPSVDSINGSLRLDGRTLTLEESGARVGGSPVSVWGRIDFVDWPQAVWEVQIKGANVPVVRRPEIILRSDLDLSLRQEHGGAAPELAGRLGLRSSTMLVEFDPLSPAVRSGPSSKPPFFAVEESPFDQWSLDLRIEGERFLRVRSPYFQAVLSAGFDLTGRLGEPLLLGSIRIDEGTLSFPGAKMRMDSGEAYIESARPDALWLDVMGTARTGTHVITMDVSGTTADPQIQFDASPPLPNAAIVRLLTTGSTTGGGAGSVGLYLGRGLLGAGGMNESFADRLTIDVGEETTRSGKNTLGVRYDVSEKVYLQGEYDVYDSYNTDLFWTIFEK